MTVVAKVYIVRHGETDANRQGIIQGQLDTVLNDAGINQARLTADALEDVPFGAAYSSDLQRAKKTAEIVLESHPNVQLETTEALRERYMGEWQGGSVARRTDPPPDLEPVIDFTTRSVGWWNSTVVRHAQRKAAELKKKRSSIAAAKAGSNGDAGKANGHTEALNGDAADEELLGLDFEPVHILAVSHGGLIGSLITNLIGSRKLQAAEGVAVGWCFNASISVIDIDETGKGVLVSYADTTHLDGDVLEHNADVRLN
ncbi:phosphoglycerate mutase-like protein [Dichomitus squalens]|uniref:Phosphoglycerate mutase-like protein n=1 Tax=Dichomitus squalens TaxID=114155 RepID=A0A4Q9QCU4_9APHY|nr:phosphoglycerate mutase-like protein [Dichomitus squalens]